MKTLIITIIASFSILSFGQGTGDDIVIMSFVKEDSILLRWAPKTPELMFEGLRKGYTIDRIQGEGDFQGNNSLLTTEIKPFEERKESFFASTDSSVKQLTAFVESLLSEENLSDEEMKITYATLMVAAGSNQGIAKLLGVFYLETNFEATNYQYRISIKGRAEGKLMVDASRESEFQSFTTLNGESRPKRIESYLSWEAKTLEAGYSGYWIERSDNDSLNFKTINKNPFHFFKSQYEGSKVNADYVDTNVVEGHTYYYRITGITHFGEVGEPSNIEPVYIQFTLKGECRIDSIYAEKDQRIIQGHFEDWDGKNHLSNFVLFKSDSLQFGYEMIESHVNENGKFEFSIKSDLLSGDRNYYKVAAVSVDKDTLNSYPSYFFTLDQEPPAIPVGLKGVINDSGIVKLSWDRNSENDIQGYRVFRANALHEEFIEVSKFYIQSSQFLDTLRLDNLTSQIFYKITAVDNNFNNSGFTEPIELHKPDTIPPTPCLFSNYKSKIEGVELNWINSSSKDIYRNYLVRSGVGRDTLLIWTGSLNSLLDTTAIAGQNLAYTIISIDESENSTSSPELVLKYETGIRPGISNFDGTVNRSEKQIKLIWELPDVEIYSIQIYRSKNEGQYKLLTTLREIVEFYEDESLSINNEYHYKVKLVYKSGHSSVMSEEVIIVY